MTVEKLHGLEQVRLTEIPLTARMRAARIACRSLCHDDAERAAVMLSALIPSDRVYWIRRQALEQQERLAA